MANSDSIQGKPCRVRQSRLRVKERLTSLDEDTSILHVFDTGYQDLLSEHKIKCSAKERTIDREK